SSAGCARRGGRGAERESPVAFARGGNRRAGTERSRGGEGDPVPHRGPAGRVRYRTEGPRIRAVHSVRGDQPPWLCHTASPVGGPSLDPGAGSEYGGRRATSHDVRRHQA